MEEDIGIKVTRLRRRLSVESEDAKSPSKQSTPSKKRGGRLATKPQLELIDENATEEEKPKRTRKSIARDIEAEEKIITPSRRSNRIKSNTSIVSETAIEEEDKGTPSRRSTRIKSNTSIVTESFQFSNSPRAKRASRRISQFDSDNESVVTPARQTRRTTKDAITTANKQVESKVNNLDTLPNEIIVDETNNTKKDNNIEEEPTKDKIDSPSIRKSPTLGVESDCETLTQIDQNNKENKPQTITRLNPVVIIESMVNLSTTETQKSETPKKNTHSISCSNLLNELESTPKQRNTHFNKSTSDIDEPKIKFNRHRTKSWTTISSILSSDINFMSDTEIIKKKKQNNNSSHNLSCGDGFINYNKQKICKDLQNYEINHTQTDEKMKHPNEKSILETSIKNNSNVSCNYDLECLSNPQKGQIKSVIYIEDSDSNSGFFVKTNTKKEMNSEDQCVPIVNHENEVPQSRVNLSCEPMDIDESLTENVSTSTFTVTNNVEGQLGSDSVLHNTSQTVTTVKSRSSIPELKDDESTFNKSHTKGSDNNSVHKRKSSIHIVEEIDACKNSADQSQNLSTNNSSGNNISDSSKMEISIDNLGRDSNTNCKKKSDNSISITSADNNIANNSKEMSSNSNNIDKNISVINSTGTLSPKHTNNEVESSDKRTKRKSSLGNVGNDVIKEMVSSKINEVNAGSVSAKCDSLIADICQENKTGGSKQFKNSDKSINKSSNKTTISYTHSQSLDESSSEDKSTLILSQIKNTSGTNIEKNAPFSKSLNIPNINKDTKKKNLSLTYSTSTPLHEKSKKYVNTSATNLSSISQQQENTENKRIKESHEAPVLQTYNALKSSDEDESSEEESINENKFVNDEAEEANSDYQSGDSRDEDEIEYEKQNEIIEEGESLDTEDDDFSDDSEYEKGSFIVDSDPEDNDLLSGSGDDLSSSVEELSMSAKSKKKFNERKIKERKKASREMYEARHGLDETEGSTKSNKPKCKKANRQRLESTASESEKEAPLQRKKHRRARIDSSQDLSAAQTDAENSISKTKKVRCLSDSIYEETESAEREISVRQSLGTDKIDPLSLQNVIKKEPKTPVRDLNLSTIALTNADDFETVEVDENVSINRMNSKQISDPLQTTVIQENVMDSDESISGSEEITRNYELILNDLNSISETINSSNAKNPKNKAKERIVDELNLTQTKLKKIKGESINTATKEKDEGKPLRSKIIENNNRTSIQDESSSDSINMKLLFNEDSTDNENKITSENIIPLKRIEGKTNILENTDEEEENVYFFIDAEGTHTGVNKSPTNDDTSITASTKKKKTSLTKFDESNDGENYVTDSGMNTTSSNKKIKLSISCDEPETDSDEAPLEISYHGENIITHDNNIDILETSQSGKKKKNKKKLNNSQNTANKLIVEEVESVNNTIISLTGSNKKKKKLSVSRDEQEPDADDAPWEDSYAIEKNIKTKQIMDAIHSDNVDGTETNQSAKKKKKNKKRLNDSQNIESALFGEDDNMVDVPLEKSYSIEKDSKIKQDTDTTHNDIFEAPETNQSSKKKKKNKKNIASEPSVEDNALAINEEVTSKKRKRKHSGNELMDRDNALAINEEVTLKKLKHKHSGNELIDQEHGKNLDTVINLHESTVVTQKKKRKILHQQKEDHIQTQEMNEDINQTKQAIKTYKKKNKSEETQEAYTDTASKNKKRKERDSDDCNKVSKVIKQNSFDKVHVSRLPDSVIKQLDDKSKDDKDVRFPKTNLISTTYFKIEETKKRRNKPSNYLEKSVYLNDSIEEETKKSSLLKPKVLPFIPTVSTSDHGFTTRFRVNVIPQESQFITQSSVVSNFKNDYLHKNRIKKMGTLEMCKRRRNVKLCKF